MEIEFKVFFLIKICNFFSFSLFYEEAPKSLTTNIQTNYYFIEEEEAPVKDPFKDLDPLWKLK